MGTALAVQDTQYCSPEGAAGGSSSRECTACILMDWRNGNAHGKQGSQCPFAPGGSGSSLSCWSFLMTAETFYRKKTPRKFLSYHLCYHPCQASEQRFIKGRGFTNGVEVSNVPTHLSLPLWGLTPGVPHRPGRCPRRPVPLAPGAHAEQPPRGARASRKLLGAADAAGTASHPEIA